MCNIYITQVGFISLTCAKQVQISFVWLKVWFLVGFNQSHHLMACAASLLVKNDIQLVYRFFQVMPTWNNDIQFSSITCGNLRSRKLTGMFNFPSYACTNTHQCYFRLHFSGMTLMRNVWQLYCNYLYCFFSQFI